MVKDVFVSYRVHTVNSEIFVGVLLCCVVTVKSFPVLAFNGVIITIVRIYT